MVFQHEALNNVSFRNNAIWDSYLRSYQKDSLVPGVQYPNEHLIRFIMDWKHSSLWEKGRRPKVLEFGFGNITNMAMMCKLGCDVEGMEVSQDAVRRANTIIDELGLNNRMKVEVWPGQNIPRQDNSCDVLVGLQCVYYNLDQEGFAEECARVLKPGGLLFLSFFSKNHGYMNYIDGRPGGLVKFNDAHPNPRLRGLTLFLYKDEKQFEETYGKHFFIKTGLDEYDLVPNFQSWYYVRGQKKDAPENRLLTFPLSVPETFQPPALQDDPPNARDLLEENVRLWDEYMKNTPHEKPFPGQKYPNEYGVRFLATWNRRKRGDYFKSCMGSEDNDSKIQDLKALEINFFNPVHLMAMQKFGYNACGVTYSLETKKRTLESFQELDPEKTPVVDFWDGKRFPFDAGTFDMLFSLKAAYYQPNQREFIKECARIAKKEGEIFFCYLSPKHGYCKNLEQVSGNVFRFPQDSVNPKLVGMTVFLAGKEDIKTLWSPYFDVTVKYFEYSTSPTFFSFYVVTGRKI